MATQPLVAEQPDSLSGLFDAFSKLSSNFGSGVTTKGGTETQTSSASPEAMGNANDLLASLKGGVDPNFLNDMQNQIFDSARRSVAPEIMNSIGSGNRALSDTTLQDFASRATGYATAASAQAKLEAIAKNNSLMTQVVGQQLQASRTQTATKTDTSQTSMTPVGKGLSLGAAALGGYSLYKNLNKATKAKSVKDMTDFFSDNPEGLAANSQTGTASAEQAAEFFSGDSGVTTSAAGAELGVDSSPALSISSEAAPAFELSGDVIAGGLSSEFAAAAPDVFGAATGEALGAGTVAEGGLDLGLGGGLADAGLDAGIDFGIGTATDWALGDTLVEAAPLVLGWIICTQLKEQKKISSTQYFKAARYFINCPEQMKAGYRMWARPYVKFMKHRKYGRFATAFMLPIAQGRIDQINGKWNFIGWLTFVIGEPVCMFLGGLIKEKLTSEKA